MEDMIEKDTNQFVGNIKAEQMTKLNEEVKGLLRGTLRNSRTMFWSHLEAVMEPEMATLSKQLLTPRHNLVDTF